MLIIFEIFRAEMMKCGWEIYFAGGLYNSPGTLVGPSGNSLTVFMEYWLTKIRLVKVLCLGQKKMIDSWTHAIIDAYFKLPSPQSLKLYESLRRKLG